MPRFNPSHAVDEIGHLRSLIRERGVARTYRRGDYFCHAGEPCAEIGLLCSGYFKYCLPAGAVTGLTFEEDFVVDFSAAVQNTPASTDIISGYTSEVLVLPATALDQVIGLVQTAWPILFDALYKRFLDGYRYTPEERYAILLREHPDVIQRAPLRDIASFMRITPVHLSRIRRKLVQSKTE